MKNILFLKIIENGCSYLVSITNKITILLVLVCFSMLSFGQTSYTVSNTDGGADYSSLSTLETALSGFSPGDSVLVKRGDIFNETLTITSINGINFSTYGTGAKPIFTSEDTVSGEWTKTGNIFSITLTAAPTGILHLYANSNKQLLGREPDTGYYHLDIVDKDTSVGIVDTVYDADRTEADNYWDGCVFKVHTAYWAIESRVIDEFTNLNGRFVLTSELDYGIESDGNADVGYIILNGLNTLDNNGEWFYNTTTHVLYYYGDTTGVTFTYSSTNDLITITNSSNLSFTDIKFQKSFGHGFNMTNGDSITIDSCDFFDLDFAVYGGNSDYDTIKNCYVLNSATNGIEFASCDSGSIRNSIIDSTAMDIVYANDQDGGDDMKAIHLNALYQNDRYEGCRGVEIYADSITNTGHTAIHFQMSNNSKIDANYCKNYCQLKFDAGGIYAWHNADSAHIPGEVNYVIDYDSSFITRNYLELNYFEIDGTWRSTPGSADTVKAIYDIYIDDGNMRFRVEGNVMQGGAFNLFSHNSGHSVYKDNIGYKYRDYGFYGRNNLDANKDTITDSDFTNNTWIEYWDGSEERYKYSNYFLYVDPDGNNTWSGNYNMYPFGKIFGGDVITTGYDDTRGSFGYNLTQWNSQSYVSGEDIHPFSYSDTDLSDRDSLVFIAYNWSGSSINTNTLFLDGYGYFDQDSTRIQSETIQPYEGKVYLVDRGDYTYGGEPEPPEPTVPTSIDRILIIKIDRKFIIYNQ